MLSSPLGCIVPGDPDSTCEGIMCALTAVLTSSLQNQYQCCSVSAVAMAKAMKVPAELLPCHKVKKVVFIKLSSMKHCAGRAFEITCIGTAQACHMIPEEAAGYEST